MVNPVEKVKLVAVRGGTYTAYVFQKLEDIGYIMCVRLPNWQVPEITIGDIGFLEYQVVKAGDTYFHVASQTTEVYLYSNIYFINFIQFTDTLKNNELIL